MTYKTILAAAVLALAPALASAECGWSHKINANQCGEGQTYDTTSGTCIDQSTS
jgi:hypothetical protein